MARASQIYPSMPEPTGKKQEPPELSRSRGLFAFEVVRDYLANSTARVSRMTQTLICPG